MDLKYVWQECKLKVDESCIVLDTRITYSSNYYEFIKICNLLLFMTDSLGRQR